MQLLKHYAELGRPLLRDYLKDAVDRAIESMPKSRRMKLKIRNSHPGRKFIESFPYRYAHELTLTSVTIEAADRFAA